ncbi:MAG: hypothetical protein K2X82_23750 [Gemmataceae bacterium]|nr:hypothetical protein [Gemmataceae bacterium]
MTHPTHPDCLVPWRELARLPEHELARHDIAAVNLSVAVELPGWEEMDPEGCLRTLDGWAEYTRAYTDRSFHRFHNNPGGYDRSEGYFRAPCLITALQKHLGVRYDPAKIPADARFEPADSFVYGAIQKAGGTCASLPVVYAAVGRRLGYPIRLAATQGRTGGHLFARWDGCGERFNIEATAPGLSCPTDDDYREGRYDLPPEVERWGCYLRSKSPREELAYFLAQRAHAWYEAGSHRGSVDGFAWAAGLVPDNVTLRDTLIEHMNRWTRWTKAETPAAFPAVEIGPPARRLYPDALPLDLERGILGLMAVDSLLRDAELVPVWERMRRGAWPGRGPGRVTVDYRPDGSSDVNLQLGA